jgi:glutamine amidotransferase
MDELKLLYPAVKELENLSDETRVIVSEPLGALPGAWNQAPESHYGIVQPGTDKLGEFTPQRS